MGLMAAILLASRSANPPGLPVPVSDLLLHAGAYAALALALLRGLSGARRAGVNARQALLAAVLAAAYGVADEFLQSFVPGRDAAVRDVAADAVGATTGAALGWMWCRVWTMTIRRRPRADPPASRPRQRPTDHDQVVPNTRTSE